MERTVKKLQKSSAENIKFKKVAAYARVSSGKDAMLHSLMIQTEYYKKFISEHPGWIFAGVYSDEAISGTKNKRESFEKMNNDCKAGKIDLIITKSISRFARNTVVLLETIRELRNIGVSVYFEEQNIDSCSSDCEFLLTILASVAQEESRSVSENMYWHIRKNFEAGLAWSPIILGYYYDKGVYKIKDDEAKLVRRIFNDYLSGKGCYTIAKELNDEGVPTRRGPLWKDTTIAKILRNYNYTGNLELQKTYRPDYMSKKPKNNRGERPRYLAEDTHEAIIDIKTFNAVQVEIQRRKEMYTRNEKTGLLSLSVVITLQS